MTGSSSFSLNCETGREGGALSTGHGISLGVVLSIADEEGGGVLSTGHRISLGAVLSMG